MAGQGIEHSTAALEAGLSQSDERAIVEALARVAVDDAAPEEGPLFGPMTDAYYDPKRGTPGGSKSDEMLGFGVDAAAAACLSRPLRWKWQRTFSATSSASCRRRSRTRPSR